MKHRTLTLILVMKFARYEGYFGGEFCRCEATYTRVLAEESKPHLDVNACCPGYVDTDMSSHKGYKTPLQGADTPAWLALLAPKGTTGKFFSDRKEEAF